MAKLHWNIAKWSAIVTTFASFILNKALADGGSVTLVNPLGSNCTSLTCPVTSVSNFLFTIAIPLSAIIILVGGFQMMTAAGDPEKFSKGKKTLLYAVIGFVVILLAGSVATLIQNTFSGTGS
jgi:hypothetical protein